jgi:hypothetical protein
MSETDVSHPVGKTRWRRFAMVLAPAYAAVAGILILAASGTLAVSFAISGTQFTITADSIKTGATDGNGLGFYQLGILDFSGVGTPTPQVESIIPNATITNLCQSVTVGPLTLVTKAGGGGTPATATGLVVDTTSQTISTATFTNINVGQDMGQFSSPALTMPTGRGSGPNVATGPVPAGTFGQTATAATITGARQVALGQTAASLTLPGLTVAFGPAC